MSESSQLGLAQFAISAALIGYLVRSWKKSMIIREGVDVDTTSALIILELPVSSRTRFRNEFILHSILSRNHFKKCFIRVTNWKEASLSSWLSYTSDLYSTTWNHAIKENQDFATDFIVTSAIDSLDTFIRKEKISRIFAESSQIERDPKCSIIEFPNMHSIDCGFTENLVLFVEDHPNSSTFPTFQYVAVGGSFDHLHNGHRKILHTASSLCTERLTVGISGNSLLTQKDFAEFIQPFSEREKKVTQFLLSTKPDLQLNIVKIEDPFGPTTTDPSLQAIIVSSETILGGFKINSIRSEKGWNRLVIVVVRRNEGSVLSSTFLRKMKVVNT